jgi:cytoskeleton protein RodZ
MRRFFVERSMSDDASNELSSGDQVDPAQQQNPTQRVVTPGTELAARRLELNWTVEQVASQLNLAPRQIGAIEADNYAALPGLAVTRGFIRAYAKLLRIDAAPLLLMLAQETSAAEADMPLRRTLSGTPFSEHRSSGMMLRRRQPSRLLAGGVVLLVLCGLLYAGQQAGLLSSTADILSSGATRAKTLFAGAADAVGPSGSADSAEPSPGTVIVHPAPVLPADTAPAAGPAGSPAPVVSSAPASKAAPDASSQAPSANKLSTTLDRPAGGELVVTMREDSWITLRRPDRTAIVSHLYKAGTTESFKIDGPVQLIVGNARGVDATLRGAPLEMKSKTNIARHNLK